MILKQKKLNYKILIIFFLIFIFLFLFVNSNKKLIQKEFYYLVDTIDANLNKITSFTEFYGYPNVYVMGNSFYSILEKVFIDAPYALAKIPRYISSPETDFEKLNLTYNFKNYKELLEDRTKSIKFNVQTNDRKSVDGYLEIKNKKLKVKTQIKGKLIDHFRSPKRFSLKINVKENKYFNGMKEFSIQKPESRASPFEQIFLIVAGKLDFITPKHFFYQINFNDKNWGIMNIEENISKESLELQKFNGELVIQLGDDHNLFIQKKKYSVEPLDMEVNLREFPMRFIDLNKVYSKNIFEINALRKAELNRNIDMYFDSNKMCTLALMTIMWGDPHILEFNNTQYAFDKYRLKLVPIPQDVGIGPKKIKSINEISQLPRIYLESCKSVDIYSIIDEIETALLNSKNEITKLNKTFPLNKQNIFNLLHENILFMKKQLHKKNLKLLENRYPIKELVYNKELLKDVRILNHYFYFKEDRNYLKIKNLLRSDVFVKNIKINGHKLVVNKKISGIYFNSINQYNKNFKKLEYTIEIPDKNIIKKNNNKIVFLLIINGIEHRLQIEDKFEPINLNKILINKKKDEYFQEMEKVYILKEGFWTLDEKIELDKSLIIEAGATINFINNASILINGQLEMIGKLDKKIKLFSSDKSWEGIFVNSIDNGKVSKIENSEIYNLNAYKDQNFKLNGGINFFNSNVIINNILIKNTEAEDAINFINSKFEINKLTIDIASSDAIDSDFSRGEISSSKFLNIKGDAVDTSGSKVYIENSLFKNINDKSISAGEDSFIKIDNIFFDKCLICIASKDKSKVIVGEFDFNDYELYFGASYLKKPFYQVGGNIQFINLSLEKFNELKIGQDQYSKIMINESKIIPNTFTNFEKFYKDGTFN